MEMRELTARNLSATIREATNVRLSIDSTPFHWPYGEKIAAEIYKAMDALNEVKKLMEEEARKEKESEKV